MANRIREVLFLSIFFLCACVSEQKQQNDTVITLSRTEIAETVIAEIQNESSNNISYTSTPNPTNIPSVTPSPVPDTVILTGTGDSVIDFVNPFSISIVHITGNSIRNHFAVINYDANGEYLDLLVNTTDPYDGIRPMDFHHSEHTSRFEITSSGDWRIEVQPLTNARNLNLSGSIEGNGDDVIILSGPNPDLARISGNTESHHFSVTSYDSYGNYSDLLVNTTDPYDGTVILEKNVRILVINSDGFWRIEITSR